MKRITIVLGMIFLAFSACKDQAIKTPDHLIGQDQMVEIMYDLSLLDAMKSQGATLGLQYPTASELLKKKYATDSLTFAENAKYYAADISNYKKMYEQVKERLNRESQEVNGTSQTTDPNQGVVK